MGEEDAGSLLKLGFLFKGVRERIKKSTKTFLGTNHI